MGTKRGQTTNHIILPSIWYRANPSPLKLKKEVPSLSFRHLFYLAHFQFLSPPTIGSLLCQIYKALLSDREWRLHPPRWWWWSYSQRTLVAFRRVTKMPIMWQTMKVSISPQELATHQDSQDRMSVADELVQDGVFTWFWWGELWDPWWHRRPCAVQRQVHLKTPIAS